MPNHVTNRIKFSGDPERIRAIMEGIKHDEMGLGSVDFNKIIPMPESLNITAGSITDKGLKAYKDFVSVLLFDGANKGIDLLNIPEEKEAIFLKQRTDIKEDEWSAGRQAFRNIQQYGFPTWYEWSINNWGTKWNAYDCIEIEGTSEEQCELCFNTAWSAPHPILSKLAQMYPDVEIEHEWADEDFGHNLGRIRYKGDIVLEKYIPESMKESYEFALKVHGYENMETVGLSLNSTETDYIPIWHEELSAVQFQDKVFLFSESRKTAADVPKGFYCYECRTSDDQSFLATLEPNVKVNYGGTLITDEPIEFGEKGYIDLKEEPILFPDIDEVSFERFMNDKAEIEQQRIISSLTKDFPAAINTPIYEDYLSNKTKGLDSEFIDDTLEEYFDLIDKKENYIGYIAKRPRVEKQGTHGLFSLHDEEINLESVAKDIANHDGLVFTTIMSLKRNDAEALDYARSIRWKELLKRNTIAIAKSMNISPSDLRWYAAFHNETYHPHIHLVAYSVGREPYIIEKRLDELKRTFAKDIFSSEMHNIYVEQTDRRNELRKEAKNKIEEVVSLINEGHYSNPIVADLLKQLVSELDNYSGRMMYGYLPKRVKILIDGIVDEMASDERIKELYELWYEQREMIVKIYREEMPPRVPLSSNKEFKSIRDAVLQEALRLKDISEYPFIDENVEKIYLPEKVKIPTLPPTFQPPKKYHWKTDIALSSARLFARLTQAIQDKLEEDNQTDQQVDRKVLKKIQEKKYAQGLKM